MDKKPLVSVPAGLLVVLVGAGVKAISSRLGRDPNLSSAVRALGGIVHGGVHVQLLDGFRRRTGQSLADRAVHRGASHDLAAWVVAVPVLANVDRDPARCNLAGGLAIKNVVGAYSIEGEAVAGIPLAVGPNGLVA